jgi:hypothetical protein
MDLFESQNASVDPARTIVRVNYLQAEIQKRR